MQTRNLVLLLGLALAFAAFGDAGYAPNPASLGETPQSYRIAPSDVLDISVWREESLNSKVLVRPDGAISFPLLGELAAAGLTIEQLRQEIAARLGEFLSEPEVTVAVVNTNQRVYVLGKVVKPGDFPIADRVTVTQALAMAGGLTPFADRDDIAVLRRAGAETRRFLFDYDSIEDGENLEQDILLQNGDVVVVP
jgi:polysaccharide export outer membrane protein